MAAGGFLKVRVSTARNALPTEGAQVIIYSDIENEKSEVLFSLLTDRAGQAPTVPLPAPPVEESLIPGASKPYATYNIVITKEGYYPVENVGVSIFDKVTSLQNVNLIPLGELLQILPGYPEETIVNDMTSFEGLSPENKGEQDG